jgi:hypothetical protein
MIENSQIETIQSRTLFKCEAFSAFSGCGGVVGQPNRGCHIFCSSARTSKVELRGEVSADPMVVPFHSRAKDNRLRQPLALYWEG